MFYFRPEAFAKIVGWRGVCVQMVRWCGGQIGLGGHSDGCLDIFQWGLLHEIDDIAILRANGMVAWRTNQNFLSHASA